MMDFNKQAELKVDEVYITNIIRELNELMPIPHLLNISFTS